MGRKLIADQKYFFFLLIWLVAVLAVGCSAMTVPVVVTHPAEFNLRGKNEIVIGEFKGPHAAEIVSRVKQHIAQCNTIQLIDRSHLAHTMKELKLSQSDLVDPQKRRKLGRLLTGSLLIMGEVLEYGYDENVIREVQTCYKDKKKYSCLRYTRSGSARVSVSFDLIDIETGEVLAPKVTNCRRKRVTTRIDGTPAHIDHRSLLAQCSNQVAGEFAHMIVPWQETVRTVFYKDKNLPMLETGVQYARIGDWDKAIDMFTQAIEYAAGHEKVKPKTEAKARWDLGLAYKFTQRFDEAIEQVTKAFELSGDGDYLAEIRNIEQARKEYHRLKQQQSPSTTHP